MRPLEGQMPGTPSPDSISTRRQRIATLARQEPQAAFTTLAHHIDIDWLFEAYRRTRKDGAVGVDGQTGEDYAADLGGNLQSLLDRAKSGRYQAPPGVGLRAGLPGLLVRLPAGPLGAPSIGRPLAPADGGRWRVGPGDRHPKVFRRPGPRPPARDPPPEGT